MVRRLLKIEGGEFFNVVGYLKGVADIFNWVRGVYKRTAIGFLSNYRNGFF